MIRLVNMERAGLSEAYRSMEQEFPHNELKSLRRLRELYDQGLCEPWWLDEDGTHRGYAMMLRVEGCRFVLLDYLAMLDKGSGYGSICLELLKKQYPDGILGEVEAELESLPDEVNRLRRRRQDFYQRAGFVPCPFDNEVFGVVYLIHLWARELPEDKETVCARELYRYYQAQVPQSWLDKHVYVAGQGGGPSRVEN